MLVNNPGQRLWQRKPQYEEFAGSNPFGSYFKHFLYRSLYLSRASLMAPRGGATLLIFHKCSSGRTNLNVPRIVPSP